MKKRAIFLLSLLLVSSLIVAGVGAYLKYGLFTSIGLETQENIISLPFVLAVDEELAFSVSYYQSLKDAPPVIEPPDTEPPQTLPTETTEQAQILEETATQTQTEETFVETEPTETEPTYVEVSESWFDDALFIGESRTEALRGRGRLGDADYFCGVNQSVYSILTERLSDTDYVDCTLSEVLNRKTYGKVFIHFGINECAGNVEVYVSAYQRLIDLIRKYQPDAYIIIQATLPVVQGYSGGESYYEPDKLQSRSERIRELVTDDHMRYLDVPDVLVDENGYLLADCTYDGCHPHAEGVKLWAAWLLEQAGGLNIP